MPESSIKIKGCIKKINPTDKVLDEPIYSCKVCGCLYTFLEDGFWTCPICSFNSK
jgi:rubrerythrin